MFSAISPSTRPREKLRQLLEVLHQQGNQTADAIVSECTVVFAGFLDDVPQRTIARPTRIFTSTSGIYATRTKRRRKGIKGSVPFCFVLFCFVLFRHQPGGVRW
jgi:hypothetical protein